MSSRVEPNDEPEPQRQEPVKQTYQYVFKNEEEEK